MGPGRTRFLRSRGVDLIPPQVIFFDFDGVLVESIDIKNDAFRRLYAEHGEDVVAKVLAHHAEHGGISRVVKIRDCHRMFLGIELDAEDLESLAQRFAVHVEESVVSCPAVAGAEAFLSADHKGCRYYVVSGTPEDELRRITDRRRMSRYFDGVFGSPRLKEDIVESILSDLGVAPSEALFVGDAMTDYRAAANTGVPFVGRVAPGWTSPFPTGTEIVADMFGLSAFAAAR